MSERGKWAEGELRGILQDIESKDFHFTFNRIPDAKGGFLQPAVADFQWFRQGAGPLRQRTFNGVIEVKEVEHEYLLPHKNFASVKIKRMNTRVVCGSRPLVLVAHKLKDMRKPQVTWRSPPFELFRDTVYVKGVGSWDLHEWPLIRMNDLAEFVRGRIYE